MTSFTQIRTTLTCASLAACLGITGCGKDPSGVETSPPPATVESHGHPTEGPHHGNLIELGNEEYHAELVHDEQAGTITVYILDSSAMRAVPIDATELTVNLSHDGHAEQFSLAANPESNDPLGKASRFTSSDAELSEELDHEGAEAQLVASINGKQFRGALSHDHDHEGHDHEGHDH